MAKSQTMKAKINESSDDNQSSIVPFLTESLEVKISKNSIKDSDAMSDIDNRCCSTVRSFPLSVFLIIGNEFCERFSFYGMRAILVIYFIVEHNFSEAHAILVFHAFVSVAYAAPLLGSFAADNYFGKYKVILFVSVIYVIGHVLLTLGAVPSMPSALGMFFDFIGLLIIALATGGIKPCVSAFGADQLKHNNSRIQEQYFSFFYFAVNAGSLIAILLTPTLRGRVKCFGKEQCFPLAFGVPAILMLLALLIFLAGTPLYKNLPATGNIIWKVCKCFVHGAGQRLKGKQHGKDHWIDYAHPKYDKKLVAGVKSMWEISVVFLPVPFFWALFDQQGSTWVIQARRMNAHIGPVNLLPDQMNVLNPIFIVILIPFTESVMFPLLRKGGIRITPLRRMIVGGFLAIASFLLAGFLQLEVNGTMVHPPPTGKVSVTLVNTVQECDYEIINGNLRFIVPSLSNNLKDEGPTELDSGTWDLSTVEGPHKYCSPNKTELKLMDFKYGHKSVGYFVAIFRDAENETRLHVLNYEMEKTENAESRIYLLGPDMGQDLDAYLFDFTGNEQKRKSRLIVDNGNSKHTFAGFQKSPYMDTATSIVGSNDYQVLIGPSNIDCATSREQCSLVESTFSAKSGSASVLIVWRDSEAVQNISSIRHQIFMLIPPNTISVFWQIPQFFLMVQGEVLFSIAGLEFSYSQAEPSMRSVCQAIWLLTVFFGNCMDMAISGSHVIKDAATEFFVYAVLMTVVMAAFVYIAIKYKYVEPDRWKNLETEETEKLVNGDIEMD